MDTLIAIAIRYIANHIPKQVQKKSKCECKNPYKETFRTPVQISLLFNDELQLIGIFTALSDCHSDTS